MGEEKYDASYIKQAGCDKKWWVKPAQAGQGESG
jgi:hypothetical protein